MNPAFRFSAIFARIDDFVRVLHALDARGHPIDDDSIEGPRGVLIRSVQHEGQERNLHAIVCDAKSTEELFGAWTTQLAPPASGLTPEALGADVDGFWTESKATHPFLERTEPGLRNRQDFAPAFVADNRHGVAG